VGASTAVIDLSRVPSSELAREMSRRSLPGLAARRVLKPCQFCKLPFGVRDMRKHLHVCTFNPNRYGERGVRVSKPCRYCSEPIARGERRTHTRNCVQNPNKQYAPCNYCGEPIASGTRREHKVRCASNPRNQPKKTGVRNRGQRDNHA